MQGTQQIVSLQVPGTRSQCIHCSSTLVHDISRGSTDPDSMEISSTVDQQVTDQFAKIKTMLSSFLGPRQETTRTAFCNYLESEVKALEERDFQTFRNEAVKRDPEQAEERTCQLQQPTLSRSSSATSIYVSQTFQQPQQSAPSDREYIFTVPQYQLPSSKFHPTSSADQSGTQRTAAAQMAGDYLRSCWRATSRAFKTDYLTH